MPEARALSAYDRTRNHPCGRGADAHGHGRDGSGRDRDRMMRRVDACCHRAANS